MLRQTREGADIGAEQAISLQETLRAHTLDAAYPLGTEDRIGSLTPGKLGDVVVLDADLEQTRPENFGEVHVTTTVLDGRIVHQR